MPAGNLSDPNGPSYFGIIMLIAAALFGRLARHIEEVRKGRRKFWGWQMVFESLLSPGLGFLGLSFARYFEIDLWTAIGVTGVIGYFGYRGLEYYGAYLLERFFPKKP